MDLAVLRTTVCSEAAEFDPSSLTPVGAPVAVQHWAAIENVLIDRDTIVQTVTMNGRDVTHVATHGRHIPTALIDALDGRDLNDVPNGAGRTPNDAGPAPPPHE